jgi:hypothetical protein
MSRIHNHSVVYRPNFSVSIRNGKNVRAGGLVRVERPGFEGKIGTLWGKDERSGLLKVEFDSGERLLCKPLELTAVAEELKT